MFPCVFTNFDQTKVKSVFVILIATSQKHFYEQFLSTPCKMDLLEKYIFIYYYRTFSTIQVNVKTNNVTKHSFTPYSRSNKNNFAMLSVSSCKILCYKHNSISNFSRRFGITNHNPSLTFY